MTRSRAENRTQIELVLSLFPEIAERLARCLAEGFIYQGEVCGEHARGGPSGHLPAGRFVTFLQNHDQVGNRALG